MSAVYESFNRSPEQYHTRVERFSEVAFTNTNSVPTAYQSHTRLVQRSRLISSYSFIEFLGSRKEMPDDER